MLQRVLFLSSRPTNRLGLRLFSKNSSSHLPDVSSSLTKQTTSSDGVVAIPIDFDTASTIEGSESQIVTIDIEPGQLLRAESGNMLFMTEGIKMETTTGGGLSAGMKRMLTGQNVFISDFSYEGPEGTKGTLALGTDFPSKIIRLNLEEYGGKIVCQKGALLCSSHTVDVEMEFAKKMTAGFFGGEGFVLQGLTGSGDVFIKAGGTLIRRDLEVGEVLRVSSGCLVAMESSVDFDVQTMPGFKNVMFGGEGLFVTTLTGPGTIWLQGMPPDRIISEIARRVPSGGGLGLGIPIGMGGGGSSGEATEAEGEENAESPGEISDTETESLDKAIENDRNNTIVSSGLGETEGDAESASALFGDAAGKEEAPTSETNNNDSFEQDTNSMDNDRFGEFESSSDFGTNSDFIDEPSFDSTEFTTDNEPDFENDMEDEFGQDESSFDTEDFGQADEETGKDVGSILKDIWDFFNDDE